MTMNKEQIIKHLSAWIDIHIMDGDKFEANLMFKNDSSTSRYEMKMDIQDKSGK